MDELQRWTSKDENNIIVKRNILPPPVSLFQKFSIIFVMDGKKNKKNILQFAVFEQVPMLYNSYLQNPTHVIIIKNLKMQLKIENMQLVTFKLKIESFKERIRKN